MGYTTYDYKTIFATKDNKYRVLDMVGAFGYEVIETKEIGNNITINIKRDSALSCKEELNKKFDEAYKLIKEASNATSKIKNKATMISITNGIVGLLTFGGGMSCVMTGDKTIKYMIPGILLGIVGIIIMILNDSLYKKLYSNGYSKYNPIVDTNNQKINEILKEANELLKKSLE